MLRKHLRLLGASLLVGFLLVPVGLFSSGVAYAAPGQDPVKLRIEITDNGLNGQASYTAEVQQGQTVEITFVFAQKQIVGDDHIMEVKGYNVETKDINFTNKEQTVTFVASKTGAFDIVCAIDCGIHGKLQRGQLNVVPATGSAAATNAANVVAATSMNLVSSAQQVDGSPVRLTANLKDSSGSPITRAEVHFYTEAEFAGTKGEMEIGSAQTNENGAAAMTYKPTETGNQKITAKFEGAGLSGPTEQSTELLVKSAQPAYTVAPRGLEALSDLGPWMIILIIATVWSIFFLVLYQIYRILKESPPNQA